mmetsp:Transcript_1686/g.4997  ORF Transcript_1686/g.4997 Transcript_1686/m.4997 type:complete len:430 (+) Transcript_1686:1157-2446(+)
MCPDASQRRHLQMAHDISAAPAGINVALAEGLVMRLVAIFAHHCNLRGRLQRQRVGLVFDEYCPVQNGTLRHFTMGVRSHIGVQRRLACCPLKLSVEEAGGIHRGEHMRRHAVDDRLIQLSLLDELCQFCKMALLPAGHLHVEAVAGGTQCVVGGAPIRHYEALEAEVFAQQLLQQVLVLASVHTIDFLVRAHHSSCAGLDGGLENRHVDFVLRPLGNVHVHGHAVVLLVVVQPMLHSHDDSALQSLLDEGLDKLGSQEGILARQSLERPTTHPISPNLYIGPEHYVCSLLHEFVSNGAGISTGRLGVEARGDAQKGGELRSGAREPVLVVIVPLRPVVEHQRHGALVAEVEVWIDVSRVAMAVVWVGPVLTVQEGYLIVNLQRLQQLFGTLLRRRPCGLHVAVDEQRELTAFLGARLPSMVVARRPRT